MVLAQLACSAKRLPPAESVALITPLMDNPLVADDPQLPLLIWWALEYANTHDKTDTVRFPYSDKPKLRRLLRRARRPRGSSRAISARHGTLFDALRPDPKVPRPMGRRLRGIATALRAHPHDEVPPPLRPHLDRLLKQKPKDLLVLEVLARMKDPACPGRAARSMVADASAKEGDRLKAIDLLRQVRDPRSEELFLEQIGLAKSDALKVGLLGGLEAFDMPRIAATVIESYPGYSLNAKQRAVQMLLARPAWTLALMKAIEQGKIPKTDLSVEQARAAIKHDRKEMTALVEKHFGKLAPATAGEKQARIAWLNTVLGREKGDATRGKVLFTKHCAVCHKLHGEGGKVGPDLTTADRKNRGYMLAQIVDPSGYIRPEYVVQNVLTHDERQSCRGWRPRRANPSHS